MFGKWRSPVAHLDGVQGVASSNLVFPTEESLKGNFGAFLMWITSLQFFYKKIQKISKILTAVFVLLNTIKFVS